MSWFDDEDFGDRAGRDWLNQWMTYPAPFGAWVGSPDGKRYDLLAKVERFLGTRSGELEMATERFVDLLIAKIASYWAATGEVPSKNRCAKLVAQTLDDLPPAHLRFIVEDFGWRESLETDGPVTFVTWHSALEEAFARRLRHNVHRLFLKLRGAEERSAA